MFGEGRSYIDWGLTPICEEEMTLEELMAAVGVFSKSILKTQTNKISVKLSLMGKILRACSSESEKIWVEGKSGIVVECPVYGQMFGNTKNIIQLEDPNRVFVSDTFCEFILEDVADLNFLKVDGFLSGFQNAPVELIGDLLASPLGPRLVDVFFQEMKKPTLTFQEKCYHLSRFLHVRETLLGIKAKSLNDAVLKKYAEKAVNKCQQRGKQNNISGHNARTTSH